MTSLPASGRATKAGAVAGEVLKGEAERTRRLIQLSRDIERRLGLVRNAPLNQPEVQSSSVALFEFPVPGELNAPRPNPAAAIKKNDPEWTVRAGGAVKLR